MSDIALQMPCGFVVTRSLKDLGHYKTCTHAACQSRFKSWEEHKTQASNPIKAILERKKLQKCRPPKE